MYCAPYNCLNFEDEILSNPCTAERPREYGFIQVSELVSTIQPCLWDTTKEEHLWLSNGLGNIKKTSPQVMLAESS